MFCSSLLSVHPYTHIQEGNTMFNYPEFYCIFPLNPYGILELPENLKFFISITVRIKARS